MENDGFKQCEDERLAHSGAIQPHGALLYLDQEQRISHCSAQISEFLPYTPDALLGRPLPRNLHDLLASDCTKLGAEPGSRKELFAVALTENHLLDIVLLRSSQGMVIELGSHEAAPIEVAAPLLKLSTPKNNQEALALHDKTARLFHKITGFDRVMIYTFREDGDGEVLAEARRPEVYGSYLGLRFPGSDIPLIARALYLKNPWRLIPDNLMPTIPLLSLHNSAPDLSWSDLRSVSPIHQQYLSNMCVHASLSFPIMVAGALWGLIACHHAKPRCLPLAVLRAASHHVRHYNLELSAWRIESQMRFSDLLDNRLEEVQLNLQRHGHILSAASDLATTLLSQLNACGMAIFFGEEWANAGIVPDQDSLDRLDEWFEYECSDLIYSSDSLRLTLPKIAPLSMPGMLALKLRIRSGLSLNIFFFREEQMQEVEWGGNPQKPIEDNGGENGIAPRRSFEKWLEKRMGYSRPWSNEDRIAALRLRLMLIRLYS